MPDAPDLSRYNVESDQVALADLAEHAVRLGAPPPVLRDGLTIFQDDFRYGISAWQITSGGTTYRALIVSDIVETVGAACRLVNPSDGEGAQVGLRRNFSPLFGTRFGFEVWLSIPTQPRYIELAITRYTGTQLVKAGVKVWPFLTKFSYTNSSNVDTDFATVSAFHQTEPLWLAFKLVADFTARTYRWFLGSGVVYDLSANGLYVANDTTIPQYRASLVLDGFGRGLNSLYVDRGILTADDRP